MNNKPSYNVGSLFAGIGGMCLAFQDAGANLLWANDNDKFACETYRANFNQNKLFEKDVRELTSETVLKLGSTEILTAGFPCQPFSKAGKLLGFKDPRGNLFYEIIRFINELNPKAILLENVQNLKTHDNQNTFQTIEDEIKCLGYSFYPVILNTFTHSYIPQNRERVFIVGFRKNIKDKINFQFPGKINKGELKSMRDFVNRSKKVEEKYYYTPRSQYYEMFREKIINYERLYHLRRVYVREIQNGLSPTLTANMGLGGHNVPIIKDRWGIRKLTPRE